MTPFIENKKGDKFEIVATMKDKKAYEKELQKAINKQLISKLSKEEIDKIKEAQSLSKDEAENLVSDILREKAIEIDELEISTITNRKYIAILLSKTNNMSDEAANNLIAELDERFGEEQVDERFAKILNAVFTQLGTVEYEAMPTWGLE